MKYFSEWVRSSNKKDPFDDYVVVHSSPIGQDELAMAEQYLRESAEHVVTDDAMTFIVYLDLALKDDPEIRSEIKDKSFRRLAAAAKRSQGT